MPGEFTSRFDKEILKSTLAEQNKKALDKAKEQADQDKIDADVREIGKLLDRRSGFLKERFPNSVPEKIDHLGFKLSFTQTGDKKSPAGSFFLRTRANESRMAILVESQYEIPSKGVKEYDYISLPTLKVDMDKAKRFIESKLLDFARVYVG